MTVPDMEAILIMAQLLTSLTAPAPWNGKWQEPPRLAIATPFATDRDYFPPVEFDYPFPGKVIIQEMDQAPLWSYCGKQHKFGHLILGCTEIFGRNTQYGRECHIRTAERKIIEQFHPYEVTLRHETAHCNGWRH